MTRSPDNCVLCLLRVVFCLIQNLFVDQKQLSVLNIKKKGKLGRGKHFFPCHCIYMLNYAIQIFPLPRRICFQCSVYVCLSDFKQDCAKPTTQMSMKLGERVKHQPKKNPLKFEADLSYGGSSMKLVSLLLMLWDIPFCLGGNLGSATPFILKSNSIERNTMIPLEIYPDIWSGCLFTSYYHRSVEYRPRWRSVLSECPARSQLYFCKEIVSCE